MFILHSVSFFIFLYSVQGCGIVTHIEISHRAVKYFQDDSGSKVDYAELMRKHPDALIAGSPYPDAYYDSICANGKYHDVSEDTHWAPFLKTAVDYIRQKYPQPWDEATEKLVVFMFGIMSHQVADIVWHSLGIEQGFLRTMGDINFHGSFDLAHTAGDLGGDVLTTYGMNLSYIPLVQGWYIPTDDLDGIYKLYYGDTKIPKDIIVLCSTELYLERYIPTEDLFNIYTQYYNSKDKMPSDIIVTCTSILYLARLAEHLALKEIFKVTAHGSPFLVDQFERYFLGGVDDMAGWTDRIWHETVTMFEKGSDVCSIPKSTLFLHCNSSSSRLGNYKNPGRNGYFKRPSLVDVSEEDFTITKELRGVRVKPTPAFLVNIVFGWYIPTEDLFNIYTQYYNSKDKMPSDIIVTCTSILYLARLAEHLALKEIFKVTAHGSPFLVDQFERYFLGGVDDMAGWTDRIWHETVTMFEKGSDVCSIPKSTLFLHCNSSSSRLGNYKNPGRNGYFKRPSLVDVSEEDFTITKELRGVRVKPTPAFLEKLQKKARAGSIKSQKPTKKSDGATVKVPDKVLYVKQDYARLGEQYARGDLNSDGYEDLVISAPGYGRLGSPQEGRVYIIHGGPDGIPASVKPDLDDLEFNRQGQIIKGWGTAQARFGTSVAVMDINLDGADDIAIGGPAFVEAGASPLGYNGYVLIYFGIPSKRCVARGAANITIACNANYCNVGYSLTTSDLDGDGNPDLVIGTPFDVGGGSQRGFIAALLSSKLNTGYQYMYVQTLPWKMQGDRDYGWFGYNLVSAQWSGSPVLFVNQPEFRKCQLANCSYNQADKQAVGKVTGFYGVNQSRSVSFMGTEDFAQLGWSVDIGTPFPDKNHQVIAISELGASVAGSFVGTTAVFDQAGQVLLYNSTSKDFPTKSSFKIQGDRAFGRFGAKVKFLDVNGDGLSDLLIGDPFRSEDFTEETSEGEQGHVYIYLGGEQFPYDQSKADCGNSVIHPCPQYQASMVLMWTEYKPNNRFGSNFFGFKDKNKTQLFVTAQHSSDYARLAGAVGVFNL